MKTYPFEVVNGWHRAKTEIASFEPEELFGTKLRALLQRRQSRDLFDLNEGLRQLALDAKKVIACFNHYLELEGHPISTAEAEQRMLEKLTRSLTEDIDRCFQPESDSAMTMPSRPLAESGRSSSPTSRATHGS